MKVIPSENPGKVVMEMGRRDDALLAAGATAPFRLKKILVPVDFSDCSKKALRYALPLAKLHEAEVGLIYVVPTPIFAGDQYGIADYSAIEAAMCEAGKQQLSALKMDEVRDNASLETILRAGSPSGEIVEFAKTWPADIIIISTHGNTGLKHIFLGSVTEYVVRHAPCPVLVVRENEHECIAG